MSSNRFSEEQIVVASALVSDMSSNYEIRWTVLLAQMQSGKTEAYLLVACEMLRIGRVENVVVFSGNAETDLKDQLVEIVSGGNHKFWRKYERYMEEVLGVDRDAAQDYIDTLKLKFQIVWGTELKKYSGPTREVLWIWEESHYAQTIGQCPDKFLRNIGISADGDFTDLEDKDNYVVSVSATPFSELSDAHHHVQNKAVSYMRPGAGYTSVKNIRDSGRLRQFESVAIGLTNALSLPHASPKYAIVRITNKNEEIVNDSG
jgi:hypothetical protein